MRFSSSLLNIGRKGPEGRLTDLQQSSKTEGDPGDAGTQDQGLEQGRSWT